MNRNSKRIHRVADFCVLKPTYLNDCTQQCDLSSNETIWNFFFKFSKNLGASKVKIRLACKPLFHCYNSTTLSKQTKNSRNHSQLTQFCPSFFSFPVFFHSFFFFTKTLSVNDMRPSLSCAMTISLFHVNVHWRRECRT